MHQTHWYAVVGNPIGHSKSPQLFSAAFSYLSLPATYFRLHAERVEEIPFFIREAGVKGVNITAPFKESIIPLLDGLSPEAKDIGAVNCVVVRDGALIGYNTDHIGVAESLFSGRAISGARALVVGAGGAAAATLFALRAHSCELFITNRTMKRAVKLGERYGATVLSSSKAGQQLTSFDYIVSTVPGDAFFLDAYAISKHTVVLDASYGASQLRIAAEKAGFTRIDGIEWLVHQATASFELFFNRKIPSSVMLSTVSSRTEPVSPILVGFMMSGKSKVGRSLAPLLSMPFVDTDDEIERRFGRDIVSLFQEKGESVFREEERRVLRELSTEPQVIATGGGVVLSADNRKILRDKGPVFWLFTSLDTTVQRLEFEDGIERQTRPVLHGKEWKTTVSSLFFERLPLYAEAADVVVITEDFNQEKLAEIVRDEYNACAASY